MKKQTIEQAVEELSKDWLFAGDEPKEDDFGIHKEFKDFLRQALQDTIDTVSMIVREEEATAYNKIIDTVLEAERERASEYMTPEDGAAYLEALTPLPDKE